MDMDSEFWIRYMLDVEEERQRQHELGMERLVEAYFNRDWDKVCGYISTLPVIMEDGLRLVYEELPDEKKFSLPLQCYTYHGDSLPVVREYVRQAIQYMPVEKRIPAELLQMTEITVYRAGEEALEEARYRISWTTDLRVARWFHERNINHFGRPSHLYQATIRPEDIIWYTDDMEEREVMQYDSVTNVIEIQSDRHSSADI